MIRRFRTQPPAARERRLVAAADTAIDSVITAAAAVEVVEDEAEDEVEAAGQLDLLALYRRERAEAAAIAAERIGLPIGIACDKMAEPWRDWAAGPQPAESAAVDVEVEAEARAGVEGVAEGATAPSASAVPCEGDALAAWRRQRDDVETLRKQVSHRLMLQARCPVPNICTVLTPTALVATQVLGPGGEELWPQEMAEREVVPAAKTETVAAAEAASEAAAEAQTEEPWRTADGPPPSPASVEPAAAGALLGYDTTDDGMLDAFHTNQDGPAEVADAPVAAALAVQMQTDDQVAPPRVVGWTIPDSAVAVDAPEEVWQLEAVPLPGPVAPLWGGGNAVAHQGGEGSDEEYACDEDDFDEDDDEGAQKPVLEPDPYPEPVKGPESAGARPVTPDGKSPQPHMAGRPSARVEAALASMLGVTVHDILLVAPPMWDSDGASDPSAGRTPVPVAWTQAGPPPLAISGGVAVDGSKAPAVTQDEGVAVAVDLAVVDLGGVTDAAAAAAENVPEAEDDDGSDIDNVDFELVPDGLNCWAATEEADAVDVLAHGSAQEPPEVAHWRREAAAALALEEVAVTAAEVPPRGLREANEAALEGHLEVQSTAAVVDMAAEPSVAQAKERANISAAEAAEAAAEATVVAAVAAAKLEVVAVTAVKLIAEAEAGVEADAGAEAEAEAESETLREHDGTAEPEPATDAEAEPAADAEPAAAGGAEGDTDAEPEAAADADAAATHSAATAARQRNEAEQVLAAENDELLKMLRERMAMCKAELAAINSLQETNDRLRPGGQPGWTTQADNPNGWHSS
jgi:hypothetical protein